MAQASDEVEQDLSHIHWSWPEAIAANPARSLATADLAMDYFAYSPFWDSKSNNNVLRTQRRVENPTYGHAEERSELNAFKSGFEYIVSHSRPPDLFVIQRREVESSGKRDIVSGSWFILHDKIYQSPTLYDVVSTRLKNAAALVSKTLGSLSESRPPANPRYTTIWRALPPSTPSASAESHTPTTDLTTDRDPSQLVAESSTLPQPESEGSSADLKAAGDNKKTAGGAAPSQPDWHLFNALQSTRASLSSLNELSKKPAPSSDASSEIKMIENHLLNQFQFSNPQQQQQHQGPKSTSRPGSVRSTSLLGLPQSSLNATMKGALTPGMTPSTYGAGASPARLGALSPASIGGRTSIMGQGASPMTGAWP